MTRRWQTMHPVVALAMVSIAGLLLVLATPPWSAGWLAPVAVALVSLAMTSVARVRMAVLLGACHFLVFYAVLVRWVVVVTPVALIALVVLMTLWGAVLGWLLWHAQRHRFSLWLAPACWVLVETLRSWLPWGGFPWGRLAFTAGIGDFTRLAYLVSAAGLTYAIALAGHLLARWWITPKLLVRDVRIVAASVLGLFIVVWSLSGPLPRPDKPRQGSDTQTQTVLLVQGGVPRAGLMTAEQEIAVFNNHLRTTNRAISARKLTAQEAARVLVVWPESSVGYAVLADEQSVQLLQDLVDRTGVTLLTGSVLADSVQPNGLRNRGMLWQPGRGVTQTYDKQHLVPFGEFVPFRSLARTLSPEVDLVGRDFIPGARAGTFAFPRDSSQTFGDVICFEVAYDDVVRKLAHVGFLVNQTNNATYLGTGQPEQQFRMAQVRAAEMGKYVLVAATSGVSGVIDARGRVVSGSLVRTNSARAYWSQVGLNPNPPVSQVVGPTLQWLCAGAIIAMLAGVTRRRRQR